MAIAFRGQTNIASGGATDPMSVPALPPSTATGDLVLLLVAVKYGDVRTINTPSGWTAPANSNISTTGLTNSGNDAGNIRAAIFTREKDAGWSTMPAVDLDAVPDITLVGAISYSKGAGETWAPVVCGAVADSVVGSTGIDPAVYGTTIPFATGNWFGSFAAINGDAGTVSTHTATVAGVTFGTQTTRLDGTSSGGTDIRGHSVDKSYTSGTASAGPDGALSLTTGGANGAGVMVFYKLSLGAPTVTGTAVGAASASGTVTGTVIPTKWGVLAGAASASGSASGYRNAPGAFTVDFSLYSDGSVPQDATGLRDCFLDIPRSQDEMGVRSGKLAVVDFRGPDQAFYPADTGGGRRGLLWRNTQTLTDNVWGPVEVPTGGVSGIVGGSPTLHISEDPADTWLGIAVWFIAPPYNWTELGVIGWKQEDFSYLDMAIGTTIPVPGDDIRLRSVGGYVSLFVNGQEVCGPSPIPPELLASPIHGVQMDVENDLDEAVGMTHGVTIGADSTALPSRSAPVTPGIGTQVEVASATTIAVPYPTTVVAGETLFCIICTRNGGTISASGWTDVTTSFGIAVSTSIRVIQKTATGSETGNLTVTKSTAGVMAGVIVRASGDRPTVTTLAGQGNSSASTSIPTPVAKILGPRRTMIWIGATSIDTNITQPTGFTPLSVGVSGGQAVRMNVSVALIDALADAPVSPYSAYAASNLPSRTGTAASSASSAAGYLILSPAYAGTLTRFGTGSGGAVASGTATGTVSAGATVRFGTLVGAATASGVAIGTPRKIGVLVGAATSSGVAIGVPRTFGFAVGAAIASGVMVGTPRHPGVLVGAATATGVVVGTPKKLGTAAGPATSAGTANGIVIAEVGFGVLVGAASASGVAIGTPKKLGTASGPATSGGTATGASLTVVVNGTAVGAAVGSGVIVGKRTTKGVLIGGATASGVVIGAPRRPGLLVGAATASGVVVGKVTHKGILVGAAVASGVVLGAPKKLGTAVGPATSTGVIGVGQVIHPGILAGAATAGGTVVGARRVYGTAVGGGVGGGTGTGAGVAEIITGTLIGSAVASGVVVGKVTHKGVLVGASSATGVVVGKVTRKGVLQGAGTGSGVVVASVTHPGSATSAGVGSSTVTGLRSTFGTAAGPATSGSTALGSTLGSAVGVAQGQASASGVAVATVGHANTRYARSTGGNWSANATWSKTSGGPADTTAPTASTEVVIDSLSGAVVVDTSSCVCRSLDCDGSLTINASCSLNLGDATPPTGGRILRLGTGATWTNNGFGIGFNNTTGAGVCTVTSNGKTMTNTGVVMNSNGSTISFVDAVNFGTGLFTFNSGTLLTNNNAVTWNGLSSSSGSTRVLTLGSSLITATGGNCLTINNDTGLTITANTAVFSTTQAVNPTYAGLPNVNMQGASISATNPTGNPGVLTLPYNWTWRNLTYTTSALAGTTSQVTVNDTITFTGTVMVMGYSPGQKRVLVASSILGTPRILSAAVATLSNTDFRDITGAGAATWTGASIGNALGNTNISFITPVTRYGVVAGSTSDPAMWSATSGGAPGATAPICHDTIILNAASGTGTVINDGARMSADFICTGFTGAFWNVATTEIYGNVTLSSGMSITSGVATISLLGRGAHTITHAGRTIPNTWRINAVNGSYTAQDAGIYSLSGTAWAIFSGTYNDGGQAHTFSGAAAAVRFDFGTFNATGTWTIDGTSATPWTVNAGTINAGGATITFTTPFAGSRTFAGLTGTYGTLNHTMSGSAGGFYITGANVTFGTINFSDATTTRILNFPATTPVTITQALNVNGRSGALIGLTGDVSKVSGNVTVSYLNISGSDATGGAGFFAGRTSTNGGSNTGWQFVDLVTGVAVAPATGGSTVNGIRIPVTVGIASGPATSGATATGVVVHVTTGTAVGAASASGVVVGRRTVKGIAAGPAVGGGTASGLGVAEIINGTAVGSATAVGVATGGRRLTGTAASAGTSTGASTGVVIHPGVCVGAGSSSAVASGLLGKAGVAEGSATGGSVVVGTRRTYSGFCLGPATSGSVVNGGVMAARPVAYALHRILRASRE